MKTFEEFRVVCEMIADELHAMIEVKEYREYNWCSIVFMTDKFGGNYASFHYDLRTGVITNWYGYPDEKKINGIGELLKIVQESKEEMERNRDLDAIYDRINEEYY